MPNTREKLIELIGQVQDCGCDVTDVVVMNYVENDVLADHLIANGVTVQEWISVKDRLPEGECLAVCMLIGRPAYKEMLVGYVGEDAMCESGYICESDGEMLPDVTHWMPLPQPPKGE